MQANDLVSLPGVLALELEPHGQPARLALERDEADQLAAFMADDLRVLLPGVEQARLAVVGAHFDSAELLRPGFPCFTTLENLAARVEGGVVAFGSRDGHMPAAPLAPEPALAGASLRLVPWTMLASPEQAADLGPAMEKELVGRGEIGTRTADFLMRSLDMRLEHARFFSRHDLLALVCVHYEHVNLAPLWALIETALLSPEREQATVSAHGLGWRYADGQAHAQTPGAWLRAQTNHASANREHDLAGIVFELRQYTAMLSAHHIRLAFESGHYDAGESFLVEPLAEADASLGSPELFAHEAPGLGVMALSVAQTGADGQPRLLAHAWPLSPQLDAVCRHLADTWGCPVQAQRLGRVLLDADGQLTVRGRGARDE